MDSTEKSVAIIKRAIRKHWKNGGRVIFGAWGVKIVGGKWVANKNCCALSCAIDGKPVAGKDDFQQDAALRIVDHGIDVSDFIAGFDTPDEPIKYDNKWYKAGNKIRIWVKENQK